MSCHAPNDKLLPDGLSIEMYYCELEFGHKGPHKCSGYGPWYDDSYHEANDYVEPDLATRALKAMLPADAHVVANNLVAICDSAEGLTIDDFDTIARAAAILKGMP